jgi:hypothetical protein
LFQRQALDLSGLACPFPVIFIHWFDHVPPPLLSWK